MAAVLSLSTPMFGFTTHGDDMEITSTQDMIGARSDDADIDIDVTGEQIQYHQDDHDQILEDAKSDDGLASHNMGLDSNKDDEMVDGEGSHLMELTEATDGRLPDDEHYFDEELDDAQDIVEEQSQGKDHPQDDQQILPPEADELDDLAAVTGLTSFSVHLNPAYDTASVQLDEDTAGYDEENQNATANQIDLSSDDARANEDDENGAIQSGLQVGIVQAAFDEREALQEPEPIKEGEDVNPEPPRVDDPAQPTAAQEYPYSHLSEVDAHEDEITADGAVAVGFRTNHDTAPSDNLPENYQDEVGEMPQIIPSIVVTYGDDECALFPPREGHDVRDYIFSDETKIMKTVKGLLSDLREIFWNTINDEDELSLSIEQLDLYISEDSVYASQITFSHVVEVYVRLAVNDSTGSIAPLKVSLDTSTRIPARLTYLMQAATEGKGLAELAPYRGFDELDEVAAIEDYEGDGEDILNAQEQPSIGLDHAEGDAGAPVATDSALFDLSTFDAGSPQYRENDSYDQAVNGLSEANGSNPIETHDAATTEHKNVDNTAGGREVQSTATGLPQDLTKAGSGMEENAAEVQVTNNDRQQEDEQKISDHHNGTSYQAIDDEDDLIDYSEDEREENKKYEGQEQDVSSESPTLHGVVQYANNDSAENEGDWRHWGPNGAEGEYYEQSEDVDPSLSFYADEITDGESELEPRRIEPAGSRRDAAHGLVEHNGADIPKGSARMPVVETAPEDPELVGDEVGIFEGSANEENEDLITTSEAANKDLGEQNHLNGNEHAQHPDELSRDEHSFLTQINNEFQIEGQSQNREQDASNQQSTEDFQDLDLIDYNTDEPDEFYTDDIQDKPNGTTTMTSTSPSSAKRSRTQLDDDGGDDLSNQDIKRIRS